MPTPRIIYVSYYTPNYSEYATRLRRSLDKFSLEYDIQAIKCRGGFLPNVRFKPTFLRQMLEAHPEADAIVWLDADAIVNSLPVLFGEIKQNLGVYFMKYGHRRPGEELLSGTVFLRNNAKTKTMLDSWIAAVEKAPTTLLKPEQQVLQRILPKLKISLYRLPREYCWIVKRGDKTVPVIEHHQASRTTRNAPAGGHVPVRCVRRRIDEPKRIRPPRRRKLQAIRHKVSYRRAAQTQMRPVGGIRGKRKVPPSDLARQKALFLNIPRGGSIDGFARGNEVIVCGTLPSEMVNKHREGRLVLACRAGWVEGYVRPDVLLLADREEYCAERDSGRLDRAAKLGTVILLEEQIFNPGILLDGDYADIDQRCQPVPETPFHVFSYDRRKDSRVVIPNVETFARPLIGVLDISLALMQAAAILGPSGILCAGIDLADASASLLGQHKTILMTIQAKGITLRNLDCPAESPFGRMLAEVVEGREQCSKASSPVSSSVS